MTFKDIVVLYTSAPASENTLNAALALAAESKAHVAVLAVSYNLGLPLMAMNPDPEAALLLKGAVEKAQEQAEKVADNLAAKANDLATKAGVSFDVRRLVLDPDAVPRVVALHVRHGDILLMGHNTTHFKGTESVIEGALFYSGRPLLLIPESKTVKKWPQRILVAWDNGREAARAIADAMPLLLHAKTVTVLTIGGGRKEGYGDNAGADMAHHLARHGLTVDTRHEKDNLEFPEQIILRIADQERYGLVVMGAYGHSRFRQWIMGGVTRGVLQGMKVPVLMSH